MPDARSGKATLDLPRLFQEKTHWYPQRSMQARPRAVPQDSPLVEGLFRVNNIGLGSPRVTPEIATCSPGFVHLILRNDTGIRLPPARAGLIDVKRAQRTQHHDRFGFLANGQGWSCCFSGPADSRRRGRLRRALSSEPSRELLREEATQTTNRGMQGEVSVWLAALAVMREYDACWLLCPLAPIGRRFLSAESALHARSGAEP